MTGGRLRRALPVLRGAVRIARKTGRAARRIALGAAAAVALLLWALHGEASLWIVRRVLEHPGVLPAGVAVSFVGGRIDPLTLSLELTAVRVALPGLVVRVPRLEAAVRLRALLTGRVRVRWAFVDRPFVFVDTARLPPHAAEPAAPAPDERPFNPLDPPVLADHLALIGARVVVAAPEVAVDAREVGLYARRFGGRHHLMLGVGPAAVGAGARRLDLGRLTLSASTGPGGFALDELNITATGLGVRETDAGIAGADAAAPLKARAAVEIDLGALAGATGLAALSGRVTVAARGAGTPADPAAEVNLRVRNVRLRRIDDELIFHDITIAARIDRRRVLIDPITAVLPRGTAEVRAEINLATKAVTAEVRPRGASLEDILYDYAGLNSKVRLTVDGRITARGTLAPFNVDGRARLSVRDFVLTAGGVRERGARVLMDSPARGDITCAFTVTDTAFTITGGDVYTPRSHIRVPKNRFGFGDGLWLAYESDALDADEVGHIGPVALGGRGRVRAVVDVPPNPRPVLITGEAELHGARIMRFPVGHMRTRVRWSADGAPLHFDDITISDGGGSITADVALEFAEAGVPVTAAFDVRDMPVAVLAAKLGVTDVPPAAGLVTAHAEWRGPIIESRIYIADARVAGVAWGGYTVGDLAAAATIDLGAGTVAVERARLETPAGIVEAAGGTGPGGTLAARLHAEGLRPGRLDFAPAGLAGTIDVDAALAGTVADPRGTLTAAARAVTFGRIGPHDADLNVALERRTLTAALEALDGAAAVRLTAPLDPAGEHELTVRVGGEGEGGEPLDTGPILAPFVGAGRFASGPLVRAVATARGPRNDIKRVAAELTVYALDGAIRDITYFAVDPEAPWRVRLTDGTARIERAVLDTGLGPLTPSGSLHIGAVPRLEAKVVLKTDFDRALGALAPDAAADIDARGPLGVVAAVRGPLAGAAPLDVEARLVVPQARIVPPIDGVGALDPLKAEIVYKNGRVFVPSFEARIGGGRLTVGGDIRIGADGPADAGLFARVTGVRVSGPLDVSVPVDADITLTGARAPFAAVGRVRVGAVRLTAPLSWESQIVAALPRLAAGRRAAARSADAPRAAFDIDVQAPSLVIDNNVARILNLNADLTLTGTDRNPGLIGAVNSPDGVLFFQNRTLNVRTLLVQFTARDRIEPRADIRVESDPILYRCGEREAQTRVTLALAGGLDDLLFDIRSDAPDLSDRTQLWNVFLGGDCGNAAAGAGAGAANFLGAVVSNPLLAGTGIETNLRLLTPAQSGGNSAAGQATSARLVPWIAVGKRLSSNLSVFYSTAVDDTLDARRVELRYTRDDLFVTGQWFSGTAARAEGDFGVDLRLRYEF